MWTTYKSLLLILEPLCCYSNLFDSSVRRQIPVSPLILSCFQENLQRVLFDSFYFIWLSFPLVVLCTATFLLRLQSFWRNWCFLQHVFVFIVVNILKKVRQLSPDICHVCMTKAWSLWWKQAFCKVSSMIEIQLVRKGNKEWKWRIEDP